MWPYKGIPTISALSYEQTERQRQASAAAAAAPMLVNGDATHDAPNAGWPRYRENREFGSYFFQTGKTQGILL